MYYKLNRYTCWHAFICLYNSQHSLFKHCVRLERFDKRVVCILNNESLLLAMHAGIEFSCLWQKYVTLMTQSSYVTIGCSLKWLALSFTIEFGYNEPSL